MHGSVKDLAGPIGVQLRSNQHARGVHAGRQHLVPIGADMGDAVSVCCGRMGCFTVLRWTCARRRFRRGQLACKPTECVSRATSATRGRRWRSDGREVSKVLTFDCFMVRKRGLVSSLDDGLPCSSGLRLAVVGCARSLAPTTPSAVDGFWRGCSCGFAAVLGTG